MLELEDGSEVSALPVALNLAGRPVLVLGGGSEAEEKIPKLLRAGARVTLVAEQASTALRAQVLARRVIWYARRFAPSDVLGAHLVMLTEPEPGLMAELVRLRATRRFWLCAIDQPEFSDVFLVSTVIRGPVQIGISTGGRAPLLARRLRQALDRGLDARFSELARNFAGLRARLRGLPKSERKELLERALNGFAMEVRLSYPATNRDGDPPPKGLGDD